MQTTDKVVAIDEGTQLDGAAGEGSPVSAPPSAQDELIQLKKKWGLYELGDLRARCEMLNSREQLIEGLIPSHSLTLVVGDSGLGKTPLLYQAGLCIATGTPFLDMPVKRGKVLYLDAENGLGDVDEMARRLAGFLGVPWPPEDFLAWNLNDCSARWGTSGYDVATLIRDVRPAVVFLDPLSAFFPETQRKNEDAAAMYGVLRGIMRDTGAAIVGVHHTRKINRDAGVASLEDGDVRRWFEEARGPRALINGSDVRLGIDEPGIASFRSSADLVIGGFGRIRGSIPLLHLERVTDDDGDPLGYRRVKGIGLLPQDQQEPFLRLPDRFTHKQAKAVYGKGSQATTDWLRKATAAGILEHKGREYWKVKGV